MGTNNYFCWPYAAPGVTNTVSYSSHHSWPMAMLGGTDRTWSPATSRTLHWLPLHNTNLLTWLPFSQEKEVLFSFLCFDGLAFQVENILIICCFVSCLIKKQQPRSLSINSLALVFQVGTVFCFYQVYFGKQPTLTSPCQCKWMIKDHF